MKDTPPAPTEPAPPGGDDALVERVRLRVLRAIAQQPAAPPQTVRAAAVPWVAIAEGVERQVLWSGPDVECALLRMAPGAVVPAHTHAIDEECIVLAGSVRIGDLVLQAGDFHLAPAGSAHEDTTSETGALVYLRSAPEPASS